ncbi:MAG: hypothetical protein KatS3mg088_490 [Patescibacteria group bacterium]|nr:MAG: hypothetical protein KatS3mg088_490 [Patescibacteria group bacterium]
MLRFLKVLLSFFSIIFLLYLIWPFEPKRIDDFSALPQSTKSDLTGDTIEVPNVAAYFSNNYRNFVTKYYRNEFQYKTKFPFPPLTLNHPPEYAFNYIKDQTQSTYLEEYVYPLRGSLFVNGLEPFDEKTKKPRYSAASHFSAGGMLYETKVTLRYYPTKIINRIGVWSGINLIVVFLWKLSRKLVNG